ncbi:sensor histidine kinase [Evansella cellulosilytica]|uniref:histidine kinase n=1 Tax=Evansella cellulosilytica (strain ATCC 21833 / DSM 2522 / FERM P-1141 / JCM 9156 / N-4) TaxID=649639 RepID=E6TU89_EVAC2|nr:HAMP domain-containing sensor histidine kinase [Evansella cellulosilytica]ADU28549.1 integral membrane sensor signal transduction histidine kinase [Evansella cellulosilytica DSM 2522]
MKIKTWLMISYFIVMILPITTIYALYITISSYDKEQDLENYLDVLQTFSNLEPILNNASLYQLQPMTNYEHIQKMGSDSLQINLYRPDGVQLFSTLNSPSTNTPLFASTTEVYQNLNEIQKNYRTYSLKKPVFENGELAGIYEMKLARDEWLEGVSNRTLTLFTLFSFFFILTYAVVIFLLNRKLNRPLQLLHARMTDFAKEKEISPLKTIPKDEIGELMGHFEEMRVEIEGTKKELLNHQKEKDFIVASLSHDLKTPLTVVRAYNEALLYGQLSPRERNEYKQVLFEKLDFMSQMLDDLVTYNSLQSTRNHSEFKVVDGEEFFDMLLSGYEESAASKDIQLHTHYDVESKYKVNPKQMIRLVDNVMTNGLRHTPQMKSLWIGAYKQTSPLPKWVFPSLIKKVDEWRKGGTVILVQNEGSFIDSENVDYLFQPFVQGETARSQSGSSGLGLSIAKMIIEQHGGKIMLWSEKPHGTLIACWLQEIEGDDYR